MPSSVAVQHAELHLLLTGTPSLLATMPYRCPACQPFSEQRPHSMAHMKHAQTQLQGVRPPDKPRNRPRQQPHQHEHEEPLAAAKAQKVCKSWKLKHGISARQGPWLPQAFISHCFAEEAEGEGPGQVKYSGISSCVRAITHLFEGLLSEQRMCFVMQAVLVRLGNCFGLGRDEYSLPALEISW